MFGTVFYNETIKRYVEAFGFLFKEVTITRSKTGQTQKQVVPISFAPTEHYIARNETDPNIERPVSIQLPRFSYELVGIERNADIQLNVLNQINTFASGGSFSSRFVPVNYLMTFSLMLKGRHIEDMYKVTDQILPYFIPAFNFKARIIDDMDPVNITVNLNSVNMLDRYEGSVGDDRELVWTFIFELNAPFFGPNLNEGDTLKVIRWINTSERILGSNNEGYVATSNLYPTFTGKTLLEILPTDNYTIVIDNTESFNE